MTSRAIFLVLLSVAVWAADVDLLGDGEAQTADPAAQDNRPARPGDEARREAVAALKKTFQADYARHTVKDRQRLVRHLLAGAKVGDDPVAQDAMLSEALRLAVEAEDLEGVLDVIDRLAETFRGVDPAAERLAAFRRIPRKPVAAAIVKLADAPDDQHANLIAGKWYAFSAGRWEAAIPLLQRCGEPALAELARLESARPANLKEWLLIGDAWYDLGRKAGAEDRIGMYGRAAYWYQQTQADGDQREQARINGILAQIMPLIPLDLAKIDWWSLTVSDWERIRAPVVLVQARSDRIDTQVQLGERDWVRVVPHPTDTWSFGIVAQPQKVVCNWHGQPTTATIPPTYGGQGGRRVVLGVNDQPYASLLMWLDGNDKQQPGEIGGPGHLWLGPSSDRTGESEAGGAIRVKILVVDPPDAAATSQRR